MHGNPWAECPEFGVHSIGVIFSMINMILWVSTTLVIVVKHDSGW